MAQTLSTPEVRAGFSRGPSPELQRPSVGIPAEFGGGAVALLAEQQPFLELSAAPQERILHSWPEVLAMAAAVPSPDELRHRLAEAGAPARTGDPGLTDAQVHSALELTYYLHPRLTGPKLFDVCGLRPDVEK